MALNSNALITLYELGEFIGHPVVAAHSGSYQMLINSASEYIETECNCIFLSGSIESEIFDGKGYADNIPSFHTEHVTKYAPITSTPSPTLYLWDGDSWDEVDRSTYTYDSVGGIIYFPGTNSSEYYRQPGYVGNVNSYFAEGKGNYKVTYAYGYDGVANIPSDLKMLTVILVKKAQMEIDHAGVESWSKSDGTSKTLSLDSLPSMAVKTIERYKRYNKRNGYYHP